MADIMSFFKPKPKGAAAVPAEQGGKADLVLPATLGGCASKLHAGQTSLPTVELSMGGEVNLMIVPLSRVYSITASAYKTNRGMKMTLPPSARWSRRTSNGGAPCWALESPRVPELCRRSGKSVNRGQLGKFTSITQVQVQRSGSGR
jgi:hypothetical protein